MLEDKIKSPWTVTTRDSDFSNELQNILDEQFDPERPNAVWCSDITYIWTMEEFIYLTNILNKYVNRADLFEGLSIWEDETYRKLQGTYPAIIIEFKVCGRMKKESLEEAEQSALNRIKEKNYDAELLAQGIPADRVRHYGFALEGKRC